MAQRQDVWAAGEAYEPYVGRWSRPVARELVEWPPEAQDGPLTICVAGQNPFGDVLNETLRGETVNDRPLTSRVMMMLSPPTSRRKYSPGSATCFTRPAQIQLSK